MNQDKINDGQIDSIMKDYLQQDKSNNEKQVKEEFVVNFDISYPSGNTENYVCGCESDIFKVSEKDNVKDNLKNDNEVDNYINSIGNMNMNKIIDEENYKIYERDFNGTCDEFDYRGKWENCEEEIKEKSHRKSHKANYHCDIKDESSGKITVYSTLEAIDGTRIRGVKINLYKINGISPELVDSRETDSEGKVNFKDIPEGNYRIIEIIDKKYFNKPAYVNWNEVSIDNKNKEFTVYAINTINEGYRRQ